MGIKANSRAGRETRGVERWGESNLEREREK